MAVAVMLRSAVLLLGLAAGTQVAAQPLADPTRPPAEFLALGGAMAKLAPATAGGGQIIILSGNRKQVTVNGQTGTLGGKLGDATVIGISDSEVVTRNGGMVEKTPLYGNIEKQAADRTMQQPARVPRIPRETTK